MQESFNSKKEPLIISQQLPCSLVGTVIDILTGNRPYDHTEANELIAVGIATGNQAKVYVRNNRVINRRFKGFIQQYLATTPAPYAAFDATFHKNVLGFPVTIELRRDPSKSRYLQVRLAHTAFANTDNVPFWWDKEEYEDVSRHMLGRLLQTVALYVTLAGDVTFQLIPSIELQSAQSLRLQHESFSLPP
ncbi:MAG: hypothetical protein ACFFDT_28300 [Candidatus Hodarchaeota archaeon]